MHILIITPRFFPSIGGVENHVAAVLPLIARDHTCTVVTEQTTQNAPAKEKTQWGELVRFAYPHTKIFGLLHIWLWFWHQRKLIQRADIVHIHDVFVWYFPFRFLFFRKPIVLTMHGWEGSWPMPLKNILYKKIAAFFSNSVITVGSFIQKFYGIKSAETIYGGVALSQIKAHATPPKSDVIFVGRLAPDTGLLLLLAALKTRQKNLQTILFCGDGPLRSECEKLGKVVGFVPQPEAYMAHATTVFASGYLTILQALALKKQVVVAYDNPLKKSYYADSPFAPYISICDSQEEIQVALRKPKSLEQEHTWITEYSWEKVAEKYLATYQNFDKKG